MATGVCLTLSLPPYPAGALAFVALVPLLCAVWLTPPVRRPWLFRGGLGYVVGVIHFTSTFSWIGELGPLYQMPLLRTLPFLLSLYLALYPAVWAIFAGWFAGRHFEKVPDLTQRPPLLSSLRNLGLALILAVAWVALEWLRGWAEWVFNGFGWNQLGVALHREITLIQIVDITGVGGLSFLLVACNVTALLTVLRLKAEVGRVRIRPHFDFSMTVVLVALAFCYSVRVIFKGPPKAVEKVRVATIQPNISQQKKFAAERDAETVGQIVDQLRGLNQIAAATSPDLVLWPEATVPGGMFASADSEAFVREEAARGEYALLIGTDDFASDGPSHNSAAFIVPGRAEVLRSHKTHLVPFGEYLPMRPLFGWVAGGLVPGDFEPGHRIELFPLPHPSVKLAPLICFEDTLGETTRDPVQRGAQLLVNITNDGWFGHSGEPWQHLANAIFRSIENRRPMVRGTNTGITASVDTFGRVNVWKDPFTEGVAANVIEVPVSAPLTFYTLYGELFSKLCLVITCFAVAGRVWRGRQT